MVVHSDGMMTASTLSTHPLYKTDEGYDIIMGWYQSVLDKFPVPYTSQYIPTRFGATHALVMGQPETTPLILLQGMAGSAPLWYRQVEDFAAHFRLYALDTPGQPGRSDPNPPSFFDNSYVDWLTDVLDALGLERAYLAGVCLGGWIIFRLGVVAPERIARAVMLSPMGLTRGKLFIPKSRRRDTDKSLEDKLVTSQVAPKSNRVEYDRELARAMALATRHYQVTQSAGMRSDQPFLGKVATGFGLIKKFFWPLPKGELAQFRASALLLMGEHEMLYNSRRALRRVQKYMPTVTAEVVAGAGHAAMYDSAPYVNRRIVEYLLETPVTIA